MRNRKRAWIYCRTAYPDAAELERQQAVMETYAGEQCYEVVGMTAEHGSDLSYDRPGMYEVMEAAEDGRMDILLVKNISRLGRDSVKTYRCLRWLSDRRVEVVCADGTVPQTLMETIPYLMAVSKTQSAIIR